MSSQITIVIPVFNRAHTLSRTLASIDAQTLRPDAVILVDNNSTDRSIQIMQEWAGSRRYVKLLSCHTQGAAAARNRGLQDVDTEYVMFFDSDDEMLPSHLADFAATARHHPTADIIGRDITAVMLNGSSRRMYFQARDTLFHHIFRCALSTQRYMARTSLVREAGGWDESLTGWDDFELGLRLLLLTDRIVDIGGRPTVMVHQQTESITGTSFSSSPEKWEHALERMHITAAAAGRDDLRTWLDAVGMILAAHYSKEASLMDQPSTRVNAARCAERMRHKVLDGTRHPLRMKILYWHNCIFGRLTWVLARILFPLI